MSEQLSQALNLLFALVLVVALWLSMMNRNAAMVRTAVTIIVNTIAIYGWNKVVGHGDPRFYLVADIIAASIVVWHPAGRAQFFVFAVYLMQCAAHVACIAFLANFKTNPAAIEAGWSLYLDILTAGLGGQCAVLLGGAGHERYRRVLGRWRALHGRGFFTAVRGKSMEEPR